MICSRSQSLFFFFFSENCGSSWARDRIRAAACDLHHSCGNTRSLTYCTRLEIEPSTALETMTDSYPTAPQWEFLCTNLLQKIKKILRSHVKLWAGVTPHREWESGEGITFTFSVTMFSAVWILFTYLFLFLFYLFFCLFSFSWAATAAYGSSQARGGIGAVAAGLRQSHSNMGSKPRLQPTPQLTAMWDP